MPGEAGVRQGRFPSGKHRARPLRTSQSRHAAAEAAAALSGGYAPAVNHKGVGAVFAAASQVSVRPLWPLCQGGLQTGHGWVPTVFWGADGPGDRDGPLGIVLQP